MSGFIVVLLFIAAFLVFASIRVIKEYERGVVYTFGKYTGIREPGLRLVLPVVQTMTIVDVRVRTEDIPAQDIISRDNVSVRVNAVVYSRVIDPALALNRVENYFHATSQLAQTTLRTVLGKHELDDMLTQRETLNADIQEIIDQQTESWGIKVSSVVIKHVDIDQSMVRAIAKQAEAERERRAKVINAEGELQAAKQLDEAAKILANRPETMQLRYLGTLGEFASSKTNTVVLPLPIANMLGKLSQE